MPDKLKNMSGDGANRTNNFLNANALSTELRVLVAFENVTFISKLSLVRLMSM